MYRIDKLFEDIFQPATKDEIEQRKVKKIEVFIEELIARKDCIKNDDGSYSFKGSIVMPNMNLTEMPIKFKRVEGNFYCNKNKLTTLEGCPEYVKGNFNCADNYLIILNNAPEYVGGNFDCSRNALESLEGCPEYVGRSFYCKYNKVKFTEEDVKKYCEVGRYIYI